MRRVALVLLSLLSLTSTALAYRLAYPVLFVHGWTGSDETFSSVPEHSSSYRPGSTYVYDILTDDLALGAEVETMDEIRDTPVKRHNLDIMCGKRMYYYDDDILSNSTCSWNSQEKSLFILNLNDYRVLCQSSDGTFLPLEDALGEASPFRISNRASLYKGGTIIKKAIQAILKETKASKVILVCHSSGGLMAREYLQRRDQSGNPVHWALAGPNNTRQHGVAKLVTMGTPHAGVGLLEFLPLLGPRDYDVTDYSAPMTRDLVINYGDHRGSTVFLYGDRSEIDFSSYCMNDDFNIPFNPFNLLNNYANYDVNCSEVINSSLFPSLNIIPDIESYENDCDVGCYATFAVNPAMRLPTDIEYLWVVGHLGTSGDGGSSDGSIPIFSQYIHQGIGDSADTMLVEVEGLLSHSDYNHYYNFVNYIDAPDERQNAFMLANLSTTYVEYISRQSRSEVPDGDKYFDVDVFKFELKRECNLQLSYRRNLSNLEYFSLIKTLGDIADTLYSSETSAGKFISLAGPGTYYLIAKGTASHELENNVNEYEFSISNLSVNVCDPICGMEVYSSHIYDSPMFPGAPLDQVGTSIVDTDDIIIDSDECVIRTATAYWETIEGVTSGYIKVERINQVNGVAVRSLIGTLPGIFYSVNIGEKHILACKEVSTGCFKYIHYTYSELGQFFVTSILETTEPAYRIVRYYDGTWIAYTYSKVVNMYLDIENELKFNFLLSVNYKAAEIDQGYLYCYQDGTVSKYYISQYANGIRFDLFTTRNFTSQFQLFGAHGSMADVKDDYIFFICGMAELALWPYYPTIVSVVKIFKMSDGSLVSTLVPPVYQTGTFYGTIGAVAVVVDNDIKVFNNGIYDRGIDIGCGGFGGDNYCYSTFAHVTSYSLQNFQLLCSSGMQSNQYISRVFPRIQVYFALQIVPFEYDCTCNGIVESVLSTYCVDCGTHITPQITSTSPLTTQRQIKIESVQVVGSFSRVVLTCPDATTILIDEMEVLDCGGRPLPFTIQECHDDTIALEIQGTSCARIRLR